MSKPMTRDRPASLAVSTQPTTPPAGPDKMASRPWNRLASVSPPEDIMNMSLAPEPASSNSAATRST